MNQFTFEGKQKSVLIGMILTGIVCLGITFFADQNRFWSNYLHNTVFFTGIAFIALFAYCAFMLAYAGWHTVMKRVCEAFFLFIPIGLLLMVGVMIGLWTHGHHMYHWAMDGIADPNSPNFDRILAGKAGFLNKGWYTFGSIIIVGVWGVIAYKMRSLSLQEDAEGAGDPNYTIHRNMKKWGAIFLPIGAFTSAAIIWQWIMSIDGHWYSTMFAWYATASWFVSALSLTILTLIYLKTKGYYEEVSAEHLHDLGKYMFAFSVFWTYVWFSQFMLIWYANNGEETVYFNVRRHEYTVLFFGNLILNFVLPFLILMRNSTKRKYGTLVLTSVICFFGHWWDFFNMIKPGVRINNAHASHDHGSHGGHEAHDAAAGHGAEVAAHGHEAAGHAVDTLHSFAMGYSIPGLLEIGTFIGFLGLFLFFVFNKLEKAALVPKNDPYLEESLHHHV